MPKFEKEEVYEASREVEQLSLEERKAELEFKQLQIKLMKHQLAEIESKEKQKQLSHEQVESGLKDFQAQQERGFAECNHRKGGKNLEGARGRGTDDKYAIIRHQLPFGQWMVLCTRCHKVWLPPEIAERMGQKPDSEAYKAAMEWNTDNEPSGSSLFIVVGGKEIQKW